MAPTHVSFSCKVRCFEKMSRTNLMQTHTHNKKHVGTSQYCIVNAKLQPVCSFQCLPISVPMMLSTQSQNPYLITLCWPLSKTLLGEWNRSQVIKSSCRSLVSQHTGATLCWATFGSVVPTDETAFLRCKQNAMKGLHESEHVTFGQQNAPVDAFSSSLDGYSLIGFVDPCLQSWDCKYIHVYWLWKE